MAANKLNNLTERELLLLLNEKVDRLEQEVSLQKALAEKIAQLEMDLLEQKIKLRLWGGIIGFVAGVVGSILPKLFKL